MNKLTTRSHREIQDPYVDREIVGYEDRPIARRQKTLARKLTSLFNVVLFAVGALLMFAWAGPAMGFFLGPAAILGVGIMVLLFMRRGFDDTVSFLSASLVMVALFAASRGNIWSFGTLIGTMAQKVATAGLGVALILVLGYLFGNGRK